MNERIMTYRHTCYIATLFVFLFILAGCSNEQNDPINGAVLPDGTPFEVSFGSYADGMVAVSTRSDEAELNTIDNLRLLVFDENNQFLYSRKAVLEKVYPDNIADNAHLPQKEKGKITHIYRFKVQLISSTKLRRIHFIAKHDWKGFQQDYFLEGKDAGQIITGLTTQRNELWREIKFNGLQASDFNNKVFKLLRNNARISLQIKEGGIPHFTYEGFKVYNAYDKATVAPYSFKEDGYTYHFPETPDTPTVPSDAGIIDGDSQPFKTDPIDVFERFDREEDLKPLFLILKGKYKGVDAFYKIEMKKFNETTGVSSRYDIVRNYHYHVKVNAVNNKGYATEEEAVTKPAGNNIFASTELEDYPYVSDGTHTLTVNPLGSIFVTNGMFESTVSFTGGISNVKIYPEWNTQTDEYLGEAKIEKVNETTGKLTIPVKKTPNDRELKFKANIVARPNPSGNVGIITREITLILRNPYEFHAKLISNGYNTGDEVRITFEVPSTITKTAFPFDVLISTKELTPDVSSPEKNNHMILEIRNGQYFYKYTVKSDSEIGKTITLNFKRNQRGKTENITLSSPYYKNQPLVLPEYDFKEITDIDAYYYLSAGSSGSAIPRNSTIEVKGENDNKYDKYLFVEMTKDGKCTFTYPIGMPDDISLRFTSVIGGNTYSQIQTLKELKERKSILLTAY